MVTARNDSGDSPWWYVRDGAFVGAGSALVVTDSRLKTLTRLERDGSLSMSAGGTGEGPGEFQSVLGLWAWQSDSVAVWDGLRGSLSVFSPDLQYARSEQMPYRPAERRGAYVVWPGSGAPAVWIEPRTSTLPTAGVGRADRSIQIVLYDGEPEEFLNLEDRGEIVSVPPGGIGMTRHYFPSWLARPRIGIFGGGIWLGDGAAPVLERIEWDGTRVEVESPVHTPKRPFDAMLAAAVGNVDPELFAAGVEAIDPRFGAAWFDSIWVSNPEEIWVRLTDAPGGPETWRLSVGDSLDSAGAWEFELPAGERLLGIHGGTGAVVSVRTESLGVQDVVWYEMRLQR